MSSSSSPHYRGTKSTDKEKFIQGQFKPEDGQGQMIIYPQALDIIWGGDDRYWKINKETKEVAAELVQVCWLEVTGSCDLKNVKENTEYKLEFEVDLKPDAFGWNNPVYVMAKVGDSRKWKKFDLSRNDGKSQTKPAIVFNTGKVKDPKLTFGLYDIWTGRWKGGLLIRKVIISPNKTEGQTSNT
ncbi:protein PHLOEM PROTEIN 2-LIKE A9-like [Typha angustifolia]|uniref:protein PHLOEM PROTEIN 2-LIKE A9-like n=1 Tax=Typha angustifolia TaxID=59011 RepID=UPI003C2CB017